MKNLNRFENWLFRKLIAKIVRQECRHKENITELYQAIYDQARYTFYEDNKPTLDGFLDECYQDGKAELIRPFKL